MDEKAERERESRESRESREREQRAERESSKPEAWLIPALIPQAQDVIIASRSQLRPVLAPLQATHLLGVGLKCGNVVLSEAHVIVHDGSVTAATREDATVPGQRADTPAVALHRANLLAARHIPQLHIRSTGAYG